VTPALERSGLLTTDIEVLRLHYAETLRHWAVALRRQPERIAALRDGRYCRMFAFYLSSCELGFRSGCLAVFQIQMARQRRPCR
jgi:cyclopropane-fatty-acyl-phospholipid synthase